MSLAEFIKSNTVTSDFYSIFLGRKLGAGMSREVYVCAIDPSLVIKIEVGAHHFQNIREWQIWDEVRYEKKMARWFAPCVAISECGTVLIQKRAELPLKSQYPKKIPACFVDLKKTNYGIYKNRLVAMDYGTWPTVNGFTSRLKNADWYEED